ncbi:hypothetical protein QJS66_21530 [Kocuria rhizophila]|nr:hypothetical protein QJS66_21530 [Kocuria rhizophila]
MRATNTGLPADVKRGAPGVDGATPRLPGAADGGDRAARTRTPWCSWCARKLRTLHLHVRTTPTIVDWNALSRTARPPPRRPRATSPSPAPYSSSWTSDHLVPWAKTSSRGAWTKVSVRSWTHARIIDDHATDAACSRRTGSGGGSPAAGPFTRAGAASWSKAELRLG